jgi:hypothetical protein
MILFRHADPRFPFLWEGSDQPPARWHGSADGPAHYFADTPDGAWAELLRHEEIRDADDLPGIRRALWAVEAFDLEDLEVELPQALLLGGFESYAECRKEAARLRALGIASFRTPSAALLPGGATGWIVDGGLREGPSRNGEVYVLFGPRPDLVGWRTVDEGCPHSGLLPRVRHFADDLGKA